MYLSLSLLIYFTLMSFVHFPTDTFSSVSLKNVLLLPFSLCLALSLSPSVSPPSSLPPPHSEGHSNKELS